METIRPSLAMILFLGFLVGCNTQGQQKNRQQQSELKEVSKSLNQEQSHLIKNDTALDQLDVDVRRHDGMIVKTDRHFFEVVYGDNTVRLYAYNHQADRVPLSGALGRIQYQQGGELSESIQLRFHPETFRHEENPDEGYLEGHTTFQADSSAKGTMVLFHLTGVPGTDKHLSFAVPFRASD